MEPHAFRHLPELQGWLTPPQASGLRLIDEVLATWDAQARQQGLSADWRLPDDVVERSRQAVLAQSEGCDLWVFAYGSLMWNPAIHFDEVRRARLAGHARRFALATTIGRGTPDSPGLVLTLQRGADDCEGLAFRIPQALLERESRMLWRREMIHGSYCPGFQLLHTPQGGVRAGAVRQHRPPAAPRRAVVGRHHGHHRQRAGQRGQQPRLPGPTGVPTRPIGHPRWLRALPG